MLVVSSMACIGAGRGVLAAGSRGAEGFPGLVVRGRPVAALGAQLAWQGFAAAVREGERYALMGPNGIGKALVVAALFCLGLYFSRTGGSLVSAVVDPSVLGSGAAAALGGM
jgi:hypothetical protein